MSSHTFMQINHPVHWARTYHQHIVLFQCAQYSCLHYSVWYFHDIYWLMINLLANDLLFRACKWSSRSLCIWEGSCSLIPVKFMRRTMCASFYCKTQCMPPCHVSVQLIQLTCVTYLTTDIFKYVVSLKWKSSILKPCCKTFKKLHTDTRICYSICLVNQPDVEKSTFWLIHGLLGFVPVWFRLVNYVLTYKPI